MPAVTAENVVALHSLRKAVAARCRGVEAEEKPLLRANGPVPTGDGKLLGSQTRKRETIDFTAAVERLMDTYPDEWATACSIGKGAVEKLAKASAKRGRKGAAAVEALETLRGLGAVSEESYEVLAEYKEEADGEV